jgi:hypothetical protein
MAGSAPRRKRHEGVAGGATEQLEAAAQPFAAEVA